MRRELQKRMRRLAGMWRNQRLQRQPQQSGTPQAWRGLEALESRMMLSASLGFTPTPGAGITVYEEGGVTVVEVVAGSTIEIEAAIAASDRSDIEIFQLDFTASNGLLTFGNWQTDSGWAGQTFGGLINVDDNDITDGVVTGSVGNPGLGVTTLGTFDVTVPGVAGEWLLSANVPGQINSSTLSVSGTALAADVLIQIFPPVGQADLVTVDDFGDILLRVLPATNPLVSVADAAAVAEGDNSATTELTLSGRVRDFRGEGTTSPLAALSVHTDFEDDDALDYRIENPNIPVLGAVSTTLGVDEKPVFIGGTTYSTGPNFNQWFNDVAGVNVGQDLDLTFAFDGENYTFTGMGPVAGKFYPIDNALGGNTTGAAIFGDPVAPDHNWHFTYEAAGTFVYEAKQELSVTSDDDLWVYIDGQLVIDRGGVNVAITRSVSLDSLGLTPGQTYDINFFYAERHATDAVLQIETNIPLNFSSDALSTFAEFEVTLSEASPVTVRVEYETANGTAIAGQDYVAMNGTLVFAPGETIKTVRVPIIGDTVEEAGTEAFTVVLSNATNAGISDDTGAATITDDDAPVVETASISGSVWRDTTANGVDDGDEPAVEDVTVNLFADGGVTPLRTAVTGASGTYAFENLAAGDYFVQFVPAVSETFVAQDVGGDDDTVDSDANSTGFTATFTLAEAQALTNVDAGLAEALPDTNTAQVHGFVWRDTQANDVYDGGELGVTDITVNLFAEGGVTPLRTLVTGAGGVFVFEDLPAGNYYAQFVAGDGETFVSQDVGDNDTRDSDANSVGVTAAFSVGIGQILRDIDAGLTDGDATGPTVLATVLDTDTGESAEDGLTNDTTPMLTVTFSEVVTGSAGDVSVVGPQGAVSPQSVVFVGDTLTITMDALTANGVYTVAIGGAIADLGGNPLNNGTSEIVTFTLDTVVPSVFDITPSLQEVTSPLTEIFVVYFDLFGLDEATVTDPDSYSLLAAGGDGNHGDANDIDMSAFIESVSYDPQTQVATLQLSPISTNDRYLITVKSANVTDSAGNLLNNGASVASIFLVNIASQDASVGDRVFADLNGNGVQDGGELGVPGVAVSLLDEFGGLVDSTATDIAGNYTFTGLAAGTYRVAFTAPAGTAFTIQNAGGNDAADSDADPTTGITDLFTLTAGQSLTTVDAGLVTAAGSGDGTLDATFSTSGFTTFDIANGDFDTPEAVLLQPDGKAIIVGRTYVLDNFTVADTQLFVIRVNADGSPDTTFSNDGLVNITEDFINISDAILQPDGKILVVGGKARGVGTPSHDENLWMVRLNPDGSKDNSFGNNGVVEIGTPQLRERAISVDLQSDGKIVIGALNHVSGVLSQMVVARFNTNGSLDTSYGTQGLAAVDLGFDFITPMDVRVTPSNEALLLGHTFSSDFIGLVVKFDADGDQVTDFGNGGLLTVVFPPSDDISGVKSIDLQGDKILVAGTSFQPPIHNFIAINRYFADGTPDTSFGVDGTAALELPEVNGELVDTYTGNMVVQQDNRIVIATEGTVDTTSAGVLARFTADGHLDPSFGVAGGTVSFVASPFLTTSEFRSVAVADDGMITVVGRGPNPNSQTPTTVTIARFNGSIEPFIEVDVRGNGVSIASGDVTPSPADFTDFGNVALSGSRTRTFTIVNEGNTAMALTGDPLVSVSGLDAEYFVVTSQPNSGVIPAGGSLTFEVTFTPDAERDDYEATIEVANTDSDENPYTFGIAGAGVTQIEVGTLGGDGPAKGTFTDAFGNEFDISFKGVASVQVLQEASGRLSLSLTGGSNTDALTIKSKSGDGVIDSLTSDSGAKSVSAKGIDFLGDIIFAGGVAKFDGGIVADQHLVQFGGAATDKAGKHTFEQFIDVTYISTSPVQLVVNGWDDTDPDVNPDSMTAPYAPALQAKTGDWDAAINLSGASAPGNVVLKKFSAAGTAGGVWQLAGDVGAIAVNDTDETFSAVIDGAVKSFATKAGMSGLLAGHNFGKISVKTDASNARLIAGGDFATGLTSTFIKSLSIGGAMTLSTVEVGLDFVNGDPDDVIGFVGGSDHYIKSLKVNGAAGDDNHFTAGLFPKAAKLGGVNVDPLNDPLGRFTLTEV